VSFEVAADAYDRFMGRYSVPLAPRLADLAGVAPGQRVLDVGCGAGALTAVLADIVGAENVAGADPSEPFVEAAPEAAVPVEIVAGTAESLPFEDDGFDTVVCTLVLCTVSDQDAAIGEIARVLKPGGRLLLIEHVRSDDPGVAKWQDRLDGFQKRVAHGCHANRNTAEALVRAGFAVDVESWRLPKAPPYVRPAIRGTATAAQ